MCRIEFVSTGNTLMGIIKFSYFFSRWQVRNEDKWAWLTQRDGKHLDKMKSYCIYESYNYLNASVSISIKLATAKNVKKALNSKPSWSTFFKIISREFVHFTLLFCRRRQRNLRRFITHADQLFCSFNLLF